MNGPSRARFTGIWLPMVTPMRHGEVDYGAAAVLAEHYRRAGVSGLVLFGSTGEGNLVRTAEKIAMVQAIHATNAALPIVIGAGGVDTRQVCDSIRRLDRLDVAGYLVPPPYYVRPSPEGIAWHYHQVSIATTRPVILYNVPKRTGIAMSVGTLATLTQHPQIAGVKECDPAMLDALAARGVPTLCGEDDAIVDHALCGGTGAIPVVAHLYPARLAAVMRLAQGGHADAARALFDSLRPLIRLLFEESSPAPVKAALAHQGWIADELRLPLTSASRGLVARLDQAMQRIGDDTAVADDARPSTTAEEPAMP